MTISEDNKEIPANSESDQAPNAQSESGPKEKNEKTSWEDIFLEKWIDISIDTDRQLLILATAGIGFLATVISSKGISSISQLFLVCCAGLAFMVTVASVLFLFNVNKNYLGKILETGVRGDQTLLKILDLIARLSFGSGVLLTAFMAVNIALASYETNSKERWENERSRRSELDDSQKPSKPSRAPSDKLCTTSFSEGWIIWITSVSARKSGELSCES